MCDQCGMCEFLSTGKHDVDYVKRLECHHLLHVLHGQLTVMRFISTTSQLLLKNLWKIIEKLGKYPLTMILLFPSLLVRGRTFTNKAYHLDLVFAKELEPIYTRLTERKLLECCMPGHTQNPNELVNAKSVAQVPQTQMVRTKES